MKRRIVSMFLAVIMLSSSVDVTSFAQQNVSKENLVTEVTQESDENISEEKNCEELISSKEEERIKKDSLPGIQLDLETGNKEEATLNISADGDSKNVNSVEEVVTTEADVITESNTITDQTEDLEEEDELYAAEIIASGECGDNVTWTLDSAGLVTVSGTGDMWDYGFLPYEYVDKIKRLKIENGVTSIGERAFERCSKFTGDLIIPDSVTSIGEQAFNECSGFTGDLVIPGSVTSIGNSAFSWCSGFTGNLIISEGVTSIGSHAFWLCSGFAGDLVIPNSVTEIGSSAFSNCRGFTGNLVISNRLENIETGTFNDCSGFTGDLIIPDSVSSIGNSAFYGCKGFNGSLTIGDGVTCIGESAFNGCSGFTGSLTIGNGVTSIGNSAFSNCSGFTGNLIIPDSVTSLGNHVFKECSSFNGRLTIGSSVSRIGESAFSRCSGLTGNLVIPDSVTSIESFAFDRCKGFNGSLTIGNGVTDIGGYAFNECNGFTGNLIIPESVTSIGERAFEYCSGFVGELKLPGGLTSIGEWAFRECIGFTGNLIIPNSLTRIESYSFYGCSGFTGSLIIGNSVTSIGNDAFSGCSGFKGGLIIGKNVTSIGDSAFYGCSGFTGNLNLPTSVIAIGKVAFSGCSGLTGNLTIQESVTSIGASAFSGCSGFTGNLMLPSGITDIERYVFSGCSGLTGNLTIPESVTSIGEYAFNNCSGFTGDLTIPNGVSNIENGVFYGCSGFDGKLTIPAGVTSIGMATFSNCSSLTGNLTIPESVTKIGSNAFAECRGFTGDLVIPKSIVSIERWAFNNCRGFTGDLMIPEGITKIEEGAFFYCSGLNGELNLPDDITMIGNSAFYYCGFTGALNLPESVTEIGESAFNGCRGFTGELNLPESVTKVGESAFDRCSGFTGELIIPGSLKNIGNRAFGFCSGVENVIVQYGIERLEDYAFYSCDNLIRITLPRSVNYIGQNVFDSGITIYGVAGTYAETYANENNIPFVSYEAAATKVEILPQNPVVRLGYSKQLNLKVTPADFTDPVLWESSDTSIVTVDDKGVVQGVSAGTAKITAMAGATLGEVMVTVAQPVIAVAVYPSTAELAVGEEMQLSTEVYPENATDKECEWSSEDESIATVDENGKVQAVSKGTTKIYATAKDGSGQSAYCVIEVTSDLHMVEGKDGFESSHPYENNCSDIWEYQDLEAQRIRIRFSKDTEVESNKDYIYIYGDEDVLIGTYTGKSLAGKEITIPGTSVRVKLVSDSAGTAYGFKVEEVRSLGEEKPLDEITLNAETLKIAKGSGEQLVVNYFPEDTTDSRLVSWSSSKESVATVDENGWVSAVNTGEAVIQAKVGDKTASCIVKVVIPLQEIELNFDQKELGIGDTFSAEIIYRPMNMTESKEIIWSSSNPNVASVDEQGLVRVVGYGETVIEAKSVVDERIKTSGTIISRQYIIQFDSMGGSPIEDVLCGYKKTYDCSQVIPVKENCVFIGWYKDKAFKELWTAKDLVTENITLYAKWQERAEGLWIMPIEDQTYTGKAIKPKVEVYDGGTLLQEKIDYTVSYKNNVKIDWNPPTVIITGKGNYTGKETATFNIVKKDIAAEDIITTDYLLKYNEKYQKPSPKVLHNGRKLVEGKDYRLHYCLEPTNPAKSFLEPGEHIIQVIGEGPYTGIREIKVTITIFDLMEKVKVSNIPTQSYTGSTITTETMVKPPVVKYGKHTLTEGTHYTVSYENNVEIGTATMILKGIDTDIYTPQGKFLGEKRVTFKIAGGNLKKAKVTGVPKSIVYSGNEIIQGVPGWEEAVNLVITEKGQNKELVKERDYVVTYDKNKNKGTGSIIFTGINGYSGTLKKTFKIGAYDIKNDTDDKISITIGDQTVYAKGGAKAKTVVAFGEKVLTEGIDYTVSYKNNSAANDGTNERKIPQVIIKGKGNFTGSISEEFLIQKQNIKNLEIVVSDKVYSNKKNGYKAVPKVIDLDGKALKAGKDYEKVYTYYYGQDVTLDDGTKRSLGEAVGENDIVPGNTKIKVTVTGKDNCFGTLTGEYRVVQGDISKAKISIESQLYTGKHITLKKSDITVKLGKETLSPDDFEIVEDSYTNNVKKGKATVTIRGVGNYGGIKKQQFVITAKEFVWR